jgi:hypothetical protein
MVWVGRIIEDSLPHFAVANEPIMVPSVVLDHCHEQLEQSFGQAALWIDGIEEDSRFVVEGRFGRFEAVIDRCRDYAALGPMDLQQGTPTVAVGLCAIKLAK